MTRGYRFLAPGFPSEAGRPSRFWRPRADHAIRSWVCLWGSRDGFWSTLTLFGHGESMREDSRGILCFSARTLDDRKVDSNSPVVQISMNILPSKQVLILLVLGFLGAMVFGVGCVTRYPSREDAPAGDSRSKDSGAGADGAYTEANLRPRAEQRFQAFIAALDRGDAVAARALLSSQQRDPEFLIALTPEQMRRLADWYRTYQFGGLWDDRVEFRATGLLEGQAMSSVYVHFAPAEEGITY